MTISNLKLFPCHFSKWLKPCQGGPKFSPRPNLLQYPILATSREAKPQIRDLRGPHQNFKMIKNTSIIDAHTLEVFKKVQIHVAAAPNSHSATSSNLICIQGGHAANPRPQGPHKSPKIAAFCLVLLKVFRIMLQLP